MQVAKDPAGSTFNLVTSNKVMLDRDLGEQAALRLTVNGGDSTTPIGKAGAGSVTFTVAGLDPEDQAIVYFAKESEHWPESRVLMEKLTRNASRSRGPSKAIGPAGAIEGSQR